MSTRLELLGGPFDGNHLPWPGTCRLGMEIEMESTPDRKHVYRVEWRKSGGSGGLVLRLRKSYRAEEVSR